jgi:hypothetical protein
MSETSSENERDKLAQDVSIIGLQDPKVPWSDAARAAYGRFHNRFLPRLYNFCKREMRSSLPKDVKLITFVPDVLERTARSLGRFDPSRGASLQSLEALLLAWLYQQADWCLKDCLQADLKHKHQEPDRQALHYDWWRRGMFAGQHVDCDYADNMKKLRLVLLTWPEREKEVVIRSIPYLNTETDEFELPEKEREALMQDWHFTTPNSLTVFRLRCMKKLRRQLGVAS